MTLAMVFRLGWNICGMFSLELRNGVVQMKLEIQSFTLKSVYKS